MKLLPKIFLILLLTIPVTSCLDWLWFGSRPIILAINTDKNVCGFNETVYCEVDVYDGDGDPLDISWSLIGNGTITEDPNNQRLATFSSGNTAGITTITVRVFDNVKPSVEESVQITIVVPCCNSVILTASSLKIRNGETSLLEVIISDPDGDTLDYVWEIVTGFGTVVSVPNTAQVVFTAPASGSGSTEVQVTVSDGNGSTYSESIIITVMEKTIGIVTWIDLEGGFWGIITDENLIFKTDHPPST